MNLRSMLLTASIPTQKLMQRIHPPEPLTTVDMALSAERKIREGDILVSREAWHFTNMFIPGFWSHAAIVSGEKKVIEAVAPRVRRESFVDWVIRKNFWAVLRPTPWGDVPAKQASLRAMDLVGLDYDYIFDYTNKSFYCSELVYFCYDDTEAAWSHTFTKRDTFGVRTVTPDDFYNSVRSGKMEIIEEHRDEW